MIEREACPHCAESIAIEARICGFCGKSALVDLVVGGPVAAGRNRFQAVRALAALGPPAPGTAELGRALEAPSPRLLEGVTRAFGARALAVLEAHGIAGAIEPARSAGGLPKIALAAAAVVALVVVGWLFGRKAAAPTAAVEATAAVAPGPNAATPAANRPEATLSAQAIARQALASVASVRCARSVGTGFFVSPDVLVTNAHVLCPAGESPRVVLRDGRDLTGLVVTADEALDVGVVRVPAAEAAPLALGDAGSLSLGDPIVFIGSPLGLDFTVHKGAVSNFSNRLGLAYIQLDGTVNPGNSGGPVFDRQGRVVGIVSLKVTRAEGIGLALPINYVYRTGAVSTPASASAGFEQLASKAEAEGRDAAQAVASSNLRPALLGAYVDKYKNLVARVGRLSRYSPANEEVAFYVSRGAQRFCTLKSDVKDWKAVPGATLGSSVDPQSRAWVAGAGLDRQVWVGEAMLRWDLCSREQMTRGVVLELEGADPTAARLSLR